MRALGGDYARAEGAWTPTHPRRLPPHVRTFEWYRWRWRRFYPPPPPCLENSSPRSPVPPTSHAFVIVIFCWMSRVDPVGRLCVSIWNRSLPQSRQTCGIPWREAKLVGRSSPSRRRGWLSRSNRLGAEGDARIKAPGRYPLARRAQVTVKYEIAGAPEGTEPLVMRKLYRFAVTNPVELSTLCTSVRGCPYVEMLLRNRTQVRRPASGGCRVRREVSWFMERRSWNTARGGAWCSESCPCRASVGRTPSR